MANGITLGRVVLSLALLCLPPTSRAFFVCYLLCGLSDVLDGFVARATHTESERGARLDSGADLVFAAVYAVKILPVLGLPPWIFAWTAAVALFKAVGILLDCKREKTLAVSHSLLNKVTGLAVFLLPLTVRWVSGSYTAAVVCAVATVATAQEWITRKKTRA